MPNLKKKRALAQFANAQSIFDLSYDLIDDPNTCKDRIPC